MKGSVIILAALAAVGASQLPRGFDSDYHDSGPPSYFDHPPPPISSPPSFHAPSYVRPLQAFADDLVYSSEPPSSSGRIFFDSGQPSYFTPRGPLTFFRDHFPSNKLFGGTTEYQGPPPLTPDQDSLSEQTITSSTLNEKSHQSLILSATKAYEEPRYQQLLLPARQPLSFGGHSSHLTYGDHSLGFASVAAVTTGHINSLANIAGSTTRTASSLTATTAMPMHSTISISASPSNAPLHPPPPLEVQKSAPSISLPKITGSVIPSQFSITSKLNKLVSTSPVLTTRLTSQPLMSGLDPVQNQLNQFAGVSMVRLQEIPKTSFDFKPIAQGLPSITHGQLPVQVSKQQFHIPDIRHNFLIYDSKTKLPYYQPTIQINPQTTTNNNNNSPNNNNASPIRFSIPTALITSTLANSQINDPIKISTQGVDFSRAPITFMAVPVNSNTYTVGRNQINTMQINMLNAETNQETNNDAALQYIIQNNEQNKPTIQANTRSPLGSLYVLPSNEQAKQASQAHSNVPSGLQLQLGDLGVIKYFMRSANTDQARPTNTDAVRVGLDLQQGLVNLPYPKIEYQQNR